jgi:prepilin-type N-terminal cleavage/methylation domain-containing protein
LYQAVKKRRRTLRPAFTLIELMVVVVIAGVMLKIALPRVDMTRIKADAVAGIVRTTLQYAERQAVTRQHDVIISFDTTGQRIRTLWDANNNGVADGTEHMFWRGLDQGVLFTDVSTLGVSGDVIHQPVSGSSIATVGGLPTITFHRDGSVSSDVEIYIKVAAHGPPWYRAVTVTQATGRISWYRLNAQANTWMQASQ